jgi:hypothetical protein
MRLATAKQALVRICSAFLVGIAAPATAARMDPIVELVSAKLDTYPLVGIGDYRHGWEESHLLRMALIADPRVICKVDAIAVEFGNSRLQQIADRYVAGEPVTSRELQSIWRETGQWMVWDSPVYEQFFAAVREANLSKRCSKPVRVVLADPPIDWNKVKSAADYQPFRDRDRVYANVVEREILAKGQRALLIAGDSHLWKVETRLGGILEQSYPGALFSIVHLPDPAQADALGLPPAPSVMLVKGTELGKRSFASWMPADRKIQVYVDGKVEERSMSELLSPPTEQVVDTFLRLDLGEYVEPDPAIYRDPVYQAQLRQRAPFMQEVHGIDFLAILDKALATN